MSTTEEPLQYDEGYGPEIGVGRQFAVDDRRTQRGHESPVRAAPAVLDHARIMP